MKCWFVLFWSHKTNKQNVTTINKKYRFQACPQSNDISKYANRMLQKWLLLVKAWNSSESPPYSLWLKKNPAPMNIWSLNLWTIFSVFPPLHLHFVPTKVSVWISTHRRYSLSNAYLKWICQMLLHRPHVTSDFCSHAVMIS